MKKVVLALALATLAMPANADDFSGSWFIRAGIADLDLSHKLSLTVGGQAVPGAALKYHPVYTPMVEIGRTFAEDWSVVATLGLPPTTSAYGSGSLAPVGKMEGITFGPTALTVQFQPIHDGLVRPYIGAGASYMMIFNTTSAAVQNPKLSNDFAPAIEAGSEFAFSEQYGLFAEVKKAFLVTKVGGTFGGNPISGKNSLDPWVFSVGATAHF
jgi:outer membrane protein